jgi:hypothetical protein
VSYEVFSAAYHPGWDAGDCLVSKAYGAAWQRSQRSLLLIVPSVVARMENNVLINDGHPEVRRITNSLHQPIWWDKRLFPDSATLPGAGVVPKRTRCRLRRRYSTGRRVVFKSHNLLRLRSERSNACVEPVT